LKSLLPFQLAGTVSDDKCMASESHTTKTYPSEQYFSDLQSYRLTDSTSVAVGDVQKEVGRSSSDF